MGHVLPYSVGVDVEPHITVVVSPRRRRWRESRSSIYLADGGSCECLWELDYRPLGFVARGDECVSRRASRPSDFWPETETGPQASIGASQNADIRGGCGGLV